ncbi:MAG: hypothetical protein AAB728_02850 [Patescibacteria group bacterium]
MPAPKHSSGSFRSVLWIAGGIGAAILCLSLALSLFLPPGVLRARRDARRQEDLLLLLRALSLYSADKGAFIEGLPEGWSREICNVTLSPQECAAEGGVDLSPLLGTYLTTIPRDPLLPSTSTGTLYALRRNANGSVTATAWGMEESRSLEFTW